MAGLVWAAGALAASAVVLAVGSAEPASGLTTGAEAPVSYGSEVRPILVKNCLVCHGFDPSTREAGLQLDTFEMATAQRPRGGAAIVPGDPDHSLVIERVLATDADERMPLKGEPLSAKEVDTLRRWIAQGAKYERHWSLEPVRNSAIPTVADAEWNEQPIDAFVRARLDAAGLAPTPEADRRTLIRRLSYDLTGLPPTPEQVRAFERDESPEAYGALVDRLLASPAFGERWARHWLDLVRYAETYAHEFDYPIRHAFEYRDYVIRAFNGDLPYDQFVTEQIAGDLLVNPRRNEAEGFNESIIGTGFWWLSEGTHAPVDVRLDEAVRIDNQIDVFSKTFLATTVSCARCHDHKFDPIYTKEYYGLSGFMRSSRRQEAYLDPGAEIAAAVSAMSAVDARARSHVARVTMPARAERVARADAYLLAAAQVLYGKPAAGEEAPASSVQEIGRFDGDDFAGWTVEGDSFGDRPDPVGDHALQSEHTAKGRGFANAHRRSPTGSSPDADKRTGRLTSDPFVIEHDYLHFLIGGGNHPDLTGVRLEVDGEVVRRATGNNSLQLEPRRFDVSDLRGREARVLIVDDATEGWGNIRADEIVLSDEPSLDRLPRRSVAAVASETGLEPVMLRRWVQALQDTDPADGSDPLGLWVRAAEAAGGDANGDISVVAAQRTDQGADGWVGGTVYAFESGSTLSDWFESGWAFGGRVYAPGGLRQPAAGGGVVEAACVDSGVLSDRLVGTLRSQTFEITQPYLAVRAKGRGTLRIIVDGYTMDEYNALIFDRVKLDIDSSDWAWHVHDVRKWIGERAHCEIIDDRTDGSIAVERAVWLAEDKAPTDAGADPGLRSLVAGAGTLGELAERFAERAARGAKGEGGSVDASMLVALERHQLFDDADETLDALGREFAQAEASCPQPRRVMAMEDGTPEDEFVFVRGNPATPGEVAPRTFLGALIDDPTIDGSTGSGRLELAERVLDESDPMVTRVMVNRVWYHLFGRGIVETTDDFGLLGATPTHPNLLDHLAWRFRHEMDWSVKTLIREIVMSKTYRMASGPLSEHASEVDPLNHLLSVRPLRRMEGEALRDQVLAISGRLDATMYGPSVPVHLTDFMTGRGRPGKSGPVDGKGRRSVYMEVRRNFLDPMMQAFDAPVPHSAMGKRSRSNVPAQSLILMNSPFMTGQAQLLAERVMGEAEGTDARLDRLYALVIARSPTEDERRVARSFLADQTALHASEQEGLSAGETERQAWVDLCHVMFNLKEFVFVE